MKVALLGNPNSGKTTLFNLLTGSTARVGNWPGVTVEKKEGKYKAKDKKELTIVDLPGIYSLSPYTPEEIVTRDFLIKEQPDVVIHIVDATNLERNLYLTTQLMEFDIPIVVAANMCDMCQKNGIVIDPKLLEEALGLPVVTISALRNTGIKELMAKVEEAGEKQEYEGRFMFEDLAAVKKAYDEELPTAKSDFASDLEAEGNPEGKKANIVFRTMEKVLARQDDEEDYECSVAEARYNLIEKVCDKAVKRKVDRKKLSPSDKADRVLTNRWAGIPIFLLVMFAVFHLTFSADFLFLGKMGLLGLGGDWEVPIIGSSEGINSPGNMLFTLVEEGTGWLAGAIADWMAGWGVGAADSWWYGLINDGILSGLFAVLSFIPQILSLFFFIGILEDSGYMARVAFILDRAFRKFGLSGKAFLPLLSCFGCAVPGIAGTRTLEDAKERQRTIYLSPFISCGAKLPIWAAFAGVFATKYGINAEGLVFGIYIFGIVMAILGAFFLKHTFIKGEVPPFVLEMPAYRLPLFRNLVIRVWDKLKHYVYRASTVIVGAIIVIWFISNFGFNFRMVENPDQSIIGILAQGLKWIFYPLGFAMGPDGWKFVVAAITGLIAKEMVVATLGTFSGISADAAEGAIEMSGEEIASNSDTSLLATMMLGIGGGMLGGVSIAVPAMLSYLAFNLLSIPCMAAVATAKAELGSRKKLWGAIAFWMGSAYVASLLVFWIGVLISWIVSIC